MNHKWSIGKSLQWSKIGQSTHLLRLTINSRVISFEGSNKSDFSPTSEYCTKCKATTAAAAIKPPLPLRITHQSTHETDDIRCHPASRSCNQDSWCWSFLGWKTWSPKQGPHVLDFAKRDTVNVSTHRPTPRENGRSSSFCNSARNFPATCEKKNLFNMKKYKFKNIRQSILWGNCMFQWPIQNFMHWRLSPHGLAHLSRRTLHSDAIDTLQAISILHLCTEKLHQVSTSFEIKLHHQIGTEWHPSCLLMIWLDD